MASMLLIDKIALALDNGDYSVCIYLDFFKCIWLLIMIYYSKSLMCTEYKTLLWNGVEIIWRTGHDM